MIDPAGELATVAIGLPHIFKGVPHWGVGKAEEAAAIPREIKRRIRAFIASPSPEPVADLPPFDYDEVRELLDTLEARAQEVTETLFDVLGSELAAPVTEVATKASFYLRSKLPRNIRSEITGNVPVSPANSAVARFARTWAVACDPLIVLRDLEEHSLTPAQVQDLAELYPAISEATKAAALEVLIARKAESPTWDLDRPRDAQLRMLLGAPPRDLGLTDDIQAIYATAPPPPTAAQARGGADLKTSLETPGQHAR